MTGPTIGTTPLRQPEPRTPLRLADIERRDRGPGADVGGDPKSGDAHFDFLRGDEP